MPNIVRAAASLTAALVFAACSSGSTAPASSPAAASVVTTASPVASAVSAVPTKFTSKSYGLSLTLPVGWTATAATEVWDGKSAPFFGAEVNDRFGGPTAASAATAAAPTTRDLAGYAIDRIAANAKEHSDTCPPVPNVKDPIKIGSEPGTFMAYDCGILINVAVAVHNGKGYVFGFRDPAVHAATDPTDRAAFLELLQSVQFPD